MADHQRVHPMKDSDHAPHSKSTTPLVGRGSFRSENGDPERQYPPLPRRRTVQPSKPQRKSGFFKKCCCWTCALLVLFIIVLGILAAIIYFVFQPKVPEYSVDSLRITHFNLTNDNSLSASFNVDITARNPNKKIGIYYVSGSHLSVWYLRTKLCEGVLPEFYQGHRNTTVLRLMLAGQTQDAMGLVQSILLVKQETGGVPLNLRATVPVRLKMGKLKLMRWKVLVRCRLVVDSLDENSVDVRIRESSCKFRFRL